jgi:CRP/FNR family transcriptional regulator
MPRTFFQSLPKDHIFQELTVRQPSRSARDDPVNRTPVEKLKSISFFRDLSPEALELVFDRMVHRTVPSGTMLFRKGERARGVYVLVKGRVEIYRSTADGREQVLHSEAPVQSVAELPVFDGGDYPASGRTAEDSELYFLALEDFQRLYREHPEIADTVIRNLGQRLRKLVGVLEKVSLRSIPSRVAKTLLEQAEKAGSLEDGGSFRLTRTQATLAHELATSRESVARALGDMRRRGIISTEGRRVTIVSLRALLGLARGEE